MAKSDSFPETAMRDVVEAASEWLSISELPATDTRLKAPLAIWDIGSGTSLRDAATPSGEWHHQIVHAGRGIAFGRSRLAGDRAELIELAESPLTEALEDALRTLRSNIDDSTVLRLIRIPRNHTTCLWLYNAEGGDEVVTLQSPVWDRNLRIDENTFLRMVNALPGPGLTAPELVQLGGAEVINVSAPPELQSAVVIEELAGQILGDWFGPGEEIEIPYGWPTGAVVQSDDRALDLVYIERAWYPLSEAAVYTYRHSTGLMAGEPWRFVTRGEPRTTFRASFDARLTRQQVAERYGADAGARCRDDRLTMQLRLTRE